MPFQECHSPFQVDQLYKDMYPQLAGSPVRQALAGMVTHTDEMIGDIVRQWGFLDLICVSLTWKVSRLLQIATLKGTAAWDNTLVVFSPTQPPDLSRHPAQTALL